MAVYCRILELDPDRFSATCSCRSSDLKNLRPQNSDPDSYFDHLAAEVNFLDCLLFEELKIYSIYHWMGSFYYFF